MENWQVSSKLSLKAGLPRLAFWPAALWRFGNPGSVHAWAIGIPSDASQPKIVLMVVITVFDGIA